jgi:hypothetical protein
MTTNTLYFVASDAPPEMTSSTIRALRSSFDGGDMVAVEWYDARTFRRAPWDPWCDKEKMEPNVGHSLGFIYDSPEEMSVVIEPHCVPGSLVERGDNAVGEVIIPYCSIICIYHLRNFRAAAFNCDTSGRSARVAPKAIAKDNTRSR